MHWILLVVSMILTPGGMTSPLTPAGEKPPVVTMSVDSGQTIMARGDTNFLLCTLRIPDGYHIYWSNPGASGTATEIEITAPAGYEIDPMRWPRPEVFNEPEGTTYGYTDRVTFVIPFRGAVQFPEPCEFLVSARWLACKKVCFMGSASSRIEVSLVDHVAVEPSVAMREAESLIPVPISERPSTRVTFAGDRMVISGPTDPAGAPGFIPGHVSGVVLGEPTVRADDARFEMVIPVDLEPENALGAVRAVHGLLIFGMNPQDPSYTIRMPILRPTPPDSGPGGSDGGED